MFMFISEMNQTIKAQAVKSIVEKVGLHHGQNPGDDHWKVQW